MFLQCAFLNPLLMESCLFFARPFILMVKEVNGMPCVEILILALYD